MEGINRSIILMLHLLTHSSNDVPENHRNPVYIIHRTPSTSLIQGETENNEQVAMCPKEQGF